MDKMETIRKWSGGLFLFGIVFNLLCASWMNLSGTCPVFTQSLSSTATERSLPPCHGESSDSTPSESSAPCCSSEIVKVDSSLEFRFEVQKFFQSNEMLVLFFFPAGWIFNPTDRIVDSNRSQELSFSAFKIPLSFLQVFRI
ncbi:hypothetical protein JWG45_00245 [Leptospira sp. 201903070]|uniref:Uncharacterized protein n=1 Tax=Leptospira ainlahdjerensis TaxID=2810033 RepID=A0ABS2U6Z1_9LEPT|nr:hypothetical protein [Leptospira ainlahdjerensis]MBM9575569.1 hypothetical protein [Leptospira ainlahdjerensis]